MSINRWMDKEVVVHIYNGILPNIKMKKVIPFAAMWVDLDFIIISEVSQRKTNVIWYCLCVETKIWYKRAYLQNRNRLKNIENKLMVTKGGRGGKGYIWSLGLSDCCYCSVAKSPPILCDPMDCSTAGLPVFHHLLEFTQLHGIGDAIQLSHPLLPPSPPTLNLSQNQDLFQWVSSSHQVAKVLELQHQSFQWVFRVDFP